jgi:hypothetical protein
MENARGDFAQHQATELARVDAFMAAAVVRGDLRLVAKFCELRCKILGLLKPKTVVQPVAPVPAEVWAAIQGAADAEPPDAIEARLAPDPEAEARARIPVLEARLKELNGKTGGDK